MATHGTTHEGHAGPPKAFGLHGMVLFGGRQGLFASHLPMYHPPHNYQVLLSIRFSDDGIDEELRAALVGTLVVWTLVPQKFDLTQLVAEGPSRLTTLHADVFEGHFERGGVKRHSHVRVQVVYVLRYEELDPSPRPLEEAHYQPYGASPEWFLVKSISARPDFDHIVAVSSASHPAAFWIAVDDLQQPADEVLKSSLPADGQLRGTVYFENRELQ